MDNRVYEYYRKMGYKCFEKYYLLDLIFPPQDGMKDEHKTIYETIAYAIKENNHILMSEAGDFLFSIGFHDWGNHLLKISVGMRNQYTRNSNLKKVRR